MSHQADTERQARLADVWSAQQTLVTRCAPGSQCFPTVASGNWLLTPPSSPDEDSDVPSRAPANPATLDALRRWAVLLDSAFRIPGTRIRFGLDAIVGLIPGLGDMSTPAFAALLLLQAVRMRLPAVVQARMVINAGLDMLLGLVPILGDLVDIGWKANLRNLALLERHARPGAPPSRGDYVFVAICVSLLALIAIAPVVVLVWLLKNVGAR